MTIFDAAPTRLKFHAAVTPGQSPNNEDVRDEGVLPFIQGCAEFGDWHPTATKFCEVAPKVAEAGDVLISVRAPVGALNIAEQSLGIGRGVAAVRARPGFHSRFMYWLLSGSNEELRSHATGTTFEAVSATDIGNLPFKIGTPDEQERIANFLDEKTSRIDALIAEKDRLSRTLDELRLSKLEAEMAGALATGSQQLRRVMLSLSQGWSPVAESYPAAPDAWGVLKLSAIKNGRFVSSENKQVSVGTEVPEELRVRKGDVLLTRANTPQLVGSVALVSDDFHCLFPSDLIYTLRIDHREFDARFLVLYLQSPQARARIEVDARGSSQSMVKLSQEHIRSWRIPQLTLRRQAEVVERIQQEFAAIGGLKMHVAEHIDRLREYRSSLISAAVTGQLDLSTFKKTVQ